MRRWLRIQWGLFLIWLSFLGAAIDQGTVSKLLNATLPVGTSGVCGTQTAFNTSSAMKLKLTSTASSASASGTEITGTGYTAGGTAITTASTTSSSGSAVSLPNMAAGISWTNGSGSSWSIVSLELPDGGATRTWFGNWNGQPVSIANGNTFLVAQNAVSVSLS